MFDMLRILIKLAKKTCGFRSFEKLKELSKLNDEELDDLLDKRADPLVQKNID